MKDQDLTTLMNKTTYTPLACHLYDELEIAAMRKRAVELVVMAEESESTLTTVIADLWARDGVEYMKLADGTVYRLDQIRSFDGTSLVSEDGSAPSCNLK